MKNRIPQLKYTIPLSFIDTSNGLPSGQVHDIAQDEDGLIWSVGPAGMSCYTGSRVKCYGPKNGLSSHGLRALYIKPNKDIVIGGDVGVDILSLGKQQTINPLLADWPHGVVDKIIAGDDGNIWLSSTTGMLLLRQGNLTVYKLPVNTFPQFITCSESGELWVGGISMGLYCLSNGIWAKPIFKGLEQIDEAYFCFSDDQHGLFIGGNNKFAQYDSNDELIAITEDVVIQGVTAGLCISDELWLACNNNLYLFKKLNGLWTQWGLIYQQIFIKKLLADKQGNIWGTSDNKGFFKISLLRNILFHSQSRDAIFSIRQSKSKHMLIGGDQQSFLIPHQLNTSTEAFQILSNKTVWDLYDSSDDHLWVATADGAIKLSSVANTSLYKLTEVLHAQARVILEYENAIYIGTVHGLYKVKNNVLSEIFDNTGNPVGYVYHLKQQGNKVWIATLGNGLFQMANNVVLPIKDEVLNPLGNTYCVEISIKEDIIILQDNKIIYCDLKGQMSILAASEQNIIGWSCVFELSDNIWIGTSFGLIEFNISQKSFGRKIYAQLRKTDWEFTTARSLFYDRDNRLLYCGLNSGLTVIDMQRLCEFEELPTVYLDAVDWLSTTSQQIEKSFIVYEGKWSVNFKIYTKFYLDEDNTFTRYKLIGFNSNWSELKYINNINFTSLPVGTYILEAQAYYSISGYGPITELASIEVRASKPLLKYLSTIVSPITEIFDYYSKEKKNKGLTNQNIALKEEVAIRTSSLKTAIIQIETAKVQAEDARALAEQAQKSADIANKAKSTFLTNMSHELRTPLNAVLGFSQLLQDRTDLPSDVINHIKIIETSGEHLLDLLNDVLDMAAIEKGKISINENEFDCHQLFVSTQKMFEQQMLKKGLTLQLDGLDELPQYIKTDERKLKQIIFNLISNAYKFTEQGNIVVGLHFDAPQLTVEIKDFGSGIAENELELVFEAFGQSESSRHSQQGTGLGLPISRQFARLMGGDLTVSSEINAGSVFCLTINTESVELMEKSSDVSRVTGLVPGQHNYRILVVDDSETNRVVLSLLLKQTGFIVKTAENGQQAIELANSWKPHLIFMDQRMPDLNGDEATHQIKSVQPKIFIVALSASVLKGDKAKVLRAGGNEFIRKPYKENEIFTVIKKYLQVEYSYMELTSPSKMEEEPDLTLLQKLTKTMSEEWREQIKQNLLKGDIGQIKQLTGQIETEHPQLAEYIQNQVENYDYKKINDLL